MPYDPIGEKYGLAKGSQRALGEEKGGQEQAWPVHRRNFKPVYQVEVVAGRDAKPVKLVACQLSPPTQPQTRNDPVADDLGIAVVGEDFLLLPPVTPILVVGDGNPGVAWFRPTEDLVFDDEDQAFLFSRLFWWGSIYQAMSLTVRPPTLEEIATYHAWFVRQHGLAVFLRRHPS